LATTGRVAPLAATLGWSATAGVHPHHASEWDAGAGEQVRERLAEPGVVAVGETGLDYHYDHSPRDQQRTAFEAQLALAAETSKAVVIHARDADADMAAMLLNWKGRVASL